MAKFSGAITALVTPMHEDESVDYEGFRALVKRQLEGGIDGILPLGTTAETPTLTEDEEDEIIKMLELLKRQLVKKHTSFWEQVQTALVMLFVTANGQKKLVQMLH